MVSSELFQTPVALKCFAEVFAQSMSWHSTLPHLGVALGPCTQDYVGVTPTSNPMPFLRMALD